jgi:uncharacterized membrane protein
MRNPIGPIAVVSPQNARDERRTEMVGLGLLLLIVGIILWVTVAPVIGWILMVIGAILIVAGFLMGAVWGLSRSGRRGAAL